MKEQINIYRVHIRQPQYKQLTGEEHLRTFGDGKLHTFFFFEILQQSKSLKIFHEDYFIDKLKPLLNIKDLSRKTS